MLNPATSVSSLVEDAQRYDYYQFAGGMRWTEMCLKRVVEEYFRDEGEAWDNVLIGGYPAASINGNSVLDSVTDITTMPDTTLVDEGGSGDLTTTELETSYMYWEHLRALKLVNMSYEDWLRTFGVRGQRLDPHKPELIRYVREWQYPSNTVDPSNGTPRSAVSWSIAERADKDRFFSEPGFIFGVSVARPKTYLRAQKGSAAGLLTTAMSWLPAVLEGEPYASLLTKDASDQFITTTNGYVVDVRDLFVYGDQFINFDPSSDLTLSAVDLPTAALTNKRYPDEDDSEDLFIDDDDSESATRLRQDGVVNLQILGRQVDHT